MSTAQATKHLSKRESPNNDQTRQVPDWVLIRPSGGSQRALTYGAFGSGIVGCVIFAEHICSNCVGKHEDSDNDCRNSALILMAATFIAIAAGNLLLQSNGGASPKRSGAVTLVGLMIMAASLLLLASLTQLFYAAI